MNKKLFYGWWIVITSIIFLIYQGAIYMYGFSAFIDPILATFGWSMTEFSLASSLRSLETGVFNPLFGIIVDRFSPKKLMVIGTLVTAGGVIILGFTQNIIMFFVGFLVMGLGGSLIFGILPVTVIARWFRKDIGKANGIYYMGLGIGGVMVPLVVIILDTLGWQMTLLISAAGLLAFGIPLSFVYRSRPEDYGMVPDGRTDSDHNGKPISHKYNFETTIKEALRMRSFWFLSVVAFVQHAVLAIITFYTIPFLANYGISRPTAGMIVSLFTFVSLFGRIPFGILIDKYNKRLITAVQILLFGAGTFIFWLIDAQSPFWMIIVFGIIYGLGLSGAMVTRPPIVAEYFGTKNFGAIFGISSIATTAAYVISPPLTGLVFDTTHSYKLIWLVLTILAVVAVFLLAVMPPSRKRD